MKGNLHKANYRFWLLLLWLAFTVSLTVWWFIFGQRQLELITLSGLSSAEALIKGQKMLLWEGLTLIASLVIGAFAFFMLARKERKESQAVQKFLMTFTHELKTPIASLRLQAQELKDRLQGDKEKVLLERLVADTSRLTLQLDNSLFLASVDSESLVIEEIDFSDLLFQLREDWPALKIEVNGQARLLADKRIILSILSNIIHNAVAHGKAGAVNFEVQDSFVAGLIKLNIENNGRDFVGDIKSLGRLFQRHYAGSGSGIGLYLVNKLSKALGGQADFELRDKKIYISLSLPGSIYSKS